MKKILKEKKRYIVWILAVFLVVSFFILAGSTAMIPKKYLIISVLVLTVVLAGLFMLQKNAGKVRVTAAIVIEAGLIGICCYGMSVLSHASDMVENITEPVIETDMISAYVLKESSLQSITETEGCTIGSVVDRSGDYEAENLYEDMFDAADALRTKKIEVLFLSDAYAGIISSIEGYEWFAEETRILPDSMTETRESDKLYEQGVEAQRKKEEETDKSTEKQDEKGKPEEIHELMEAPEQVDWEKLVNQEMLEPAEGTFVAYISGIDAWGSTSVKSRSDVNILAVVNTNTKQILLVSTPRDYYVPLANSNGVRDKLTHAGIYGVQNSMDTLEMLYGVEISYYIRLNFTGFVGMIDALGGVDVYSDAAFNVGDVFSYTQGMNHLSGIEALAFARERYSFAGGDRARGTHQMEVIKAVVSKCASSAMLYNYAEVMNSMAGCFSTNMSQAKIASLVRMQLNDLSTWSVNSISVDGTGASKTTFTVPGKRAYVMVPDESTVQAAKDSIAAVIQ